MFNNLSNLIREKHRVEKEKLKPMGGICGGGVALTAVCIVIFYGEHSIP